MTERGRLWWVVLLALAALAALVFVITGANRPADPRLEAGSRVAGFDEAGFSIVPAPQSGRSEARDYCALLAQTDSQVARGLMGRSDLAGYDGMVFRFASDSSSPFYMRNVPMPLTVAWFDASGLVVSSADMAPCGDREDCPHYFPTGPYRFALEVAAGGLDRVGVGPGARLVLGGACRGR